MPEKRLDVKQKVRDEEKLLKCFRGKQRKKERKKTQIQIVKSF
jgi:hypothetical protein